MGRWPRPSALRKGWRRRRAPSLAFSDPIRAAPGSRAVDAVSVARGYEAALGAALGDDLDASVDEAAPAHWSMLTPVDEDPSLPAGASPLAARVSAPPALARRLAQVGMVARADGKRLAQELKPGQRLVSLEGDLWRWDGFVAAAEAPSAAARRLAEKNRLGDLEREAEAARQAAATLGVESAGRGQRGPRSRCDGNGLAPARPRRPQHGRRQARRLRAIRARARQNPVAAVGCRRSLFTRRRGARRSRRTQSQCRGRAGTARSGR